MATIECGYNRTTQFTRYRVSVFASTERDQTMTRIKVGNDTVTVSGRNVRIKLGPAPSRIDNAYPMNTVEYVTDDDGINTTAFHTSVINDCIRSER